MGAVQSQPVFDEFNDDFVGDKAAALEHFGSLLAQWRAQFLFAAQNRTWRSDRNTEMACDHLRLRSFAGTGSAKKDESSFHYRPYRKIATPAMTSTAMAT